MCHIRHLIQADPADRPELIGLVEACIRHFREFRGTAAGVANGSSGAAIRWGAGPQDFAFGSSPELQPNAHGHAGRKAWEAVLQQTDVPGRHLYVELDPCAGDDARAAWIHEDLPEHLNVWFLYSTPDLMRLAHREGIEMEIATLYALWPPRQDGR
jgi:hypothetical protein